MLDARIPLGVQPMQIEPRSNMLMRAAQLQGTQDQNALRQMQMAQIRAQAEEALKARAAQEAQQQQMNGYLASLSGQMGPPQPFNPAEAIQRTGSVDMAKKLQEMMQPKQDNFKVVGGSLVQIGPNGVSEAYRAPDKPQAMPSPVQEYEYAKSQGYRGDFTQWKRENARAGATSVNVGTNKPLPTAAVKQQDDLIDKMTTAKAIDADLSGIEKQIDSGVLSFGPVTNLVNQGKNVVGMSDEQSRAFGTFKSTMERLRNDSLRLNNGVQTEGDAQRAWNELFQNINDTAFVKQRLQEIRRINQRAAQLQQYRLDVLRQNFGAGELAAPTVAPAIEPPKTGKTVKRTGTHNGKKVIEYSDGSIEYAD